MVHHGGKRERATHKVTRLAQAVDKAVDKFVEEGEKIAKENPKIQADILKACHNVSTAGMCVLIKYCVCMYIRSVVSCVSIIVVRDLQCLALHGNYLLLC